MFKHPEIIIGVSVPAFFAFFYMFTVLYIRCKKYLSISYGILCLLISLVSTSIVLNEYVAVHKGLFENIMGAFGLNGMILLLCFIGIEYSYKRSLFVDDKAFEKTLHPKPILKTFYDFPHKKGALVFSYVARYSLLLGGYALVSTLIVGVVTGKELHDPLVWFIFESAAFFGAVFFMCYSFIRPLIKCPNCKLDIFYIDRELTAYLDLARIAIKTKVLECKHCQATYVLDNRNASNIGKDLL